MKPIAFSSISLAATLLASTGLAQAAKMPSPEEMWEIIQKQQREIESLKKGKQENSEKAEAAVEAVEETQKTASTGASWAENTQIGGYGELH